MARTIANVGYSSGNTTPVGYTCPAGKITKIILHQVMFYNSSHTGALKLNDVTLTGGDNDFSIGGAHYDDQTLGVVAPPGANAFGMKNYDDGTITYIKEYYMLGAGDKVEITYGGFAVTIIEEDN